MRTKTHGVTRFFLLSAAALTIAACGQGAASAAQPGPSNAVVEKLIRQGNGGADDTRKFQFHSIKVARPHVTKTAEIYGIDAGTKVWPVLVSFTMFTAGGTDVTASWSTCDREDEVQFYYFYKNQFGDWGDGGYADSENKDHTDRYGPCTKMPGWQIFTTGK